MKLRWREQAWVLGAALLGELLLLALMPAWSDLAPAGHPWKFVGAGLLSGLCYFLAVICFGSIRGDVRPRLLWFGAIVLRLAVLPMLPGDDAARYAWEGRVQLEGVNPYLENPEAPELAHLRDEAWEQINHREWAAIYPPGAELFFKLMAHLGFTAGGYKLVFAAADLGTLFLLLRLLTGAGRFRAAAWYAWNPLVIIAFAGAGHFDSLMLLFLTGAMFALHRANPINACVPAISWSAASAVLLGLAIAVKFVPIFLLPVWAFALGRRAWLLGVSLLIPYLFSLPYGGPQVVLGTLREFSEVTRFNELFWWLPEQLGVSHFLERIVEFGGVVQITQLNQIHNFVMAATVLGAAVWFRHRWRAGALAVLGLVLVLGPACHPWYVTWILPVACWRKSHPWFALSVSVLIALLVWEAGPFWKAWELTWPLRLAIILPLVAVSVRERLKQEPTV